MTRLWKSRILHISLLLLVPTLLGWKLIDVASWRPKVLGKVEKDPVNQLSNEAHVVTFSPDGKLIAVARQQWGAATGPRRGKRVVLGYNATTMVELWKANDLQRVAAFNVLSPRRSVARISVGISVAEYLCFSPDSRRLLVAGSDGLALLDTHSKQSLYFAHPWRQPKAPPKQFTPRKFLPIGFDSKGKLAFYLSRQRRDELPASSRVQEPLLHLLHRAHITVCDSTTGKILRRIPLHLGFGEWPDQAILLRDDRTLVCTTRLGTESGHRFDDAKVLTFNIHNGKRLQTLIQRRGEFNTLAASPTSPDFAVGMESVSNVQIWETLQLKAKLDMNHIRPLRFLKYDSSGKLLLGGTYSGDIVLWAASYGGIIWQQREGKLLLDASISPDGGTVATVGGDGNVRLWRVR